MSATTWALRLAMAAATVGLLLLASCGPVLKTVDNPKDGDRIALSLNQPMQVRWGNPRPDQGDWVVDRSASSPALTDKGRTVDKPAGAAQQIEVFDFVGAQKGAEALAFTFKHKDGQPPTADERVTIGVTVGG